MSKNLLVPVSFAKLRSLFLHAAVALQVRWTKGADDKIVKYTNRLGWPSDLDMVVKKRNDSFRGRASLCFSPVLLPKFKFSHLADVLIQSDLQ